MAKGDANKVQNAVDQQGGTSQNNLNNLWGQNTDRTTSFQKLFQGAQEQNLGDYGTNMGGWNQYTQNAPAAFQQFLGTAGDNRAAPGYQNFAETGGFSPSDIASIRARSVAPIRGIADNARREIQRQAALHPGQANTTAGLAKAARDTAYAAGDVSTNAEAGIAQAIQQGKLYGLQGLSSIDMANRGLNLQAIGGGADAAAKGLSGATNLYGTTPGLTNMFGNQVLNSAGQGIQMGGLQNQLGQQIMQGQFNKAQIPGDFQSALGNISGIANLVGSLVNPMGALTNIFKPQGNQTAPMGAG